jgi:hypothetical protein
MAGRIRIAPGHFENDRFEASLPYKRSEGSPITPGHKNGPAYAESRTWTPANGRVEKVSVGHGPS